MGTASIAPSIPLLPTTCRKTHQRLLTLQALPRSTESHSRTTPRPIHLRGMRPRLGRHLTPRTIAYHRRETHPRGTQPPPDIPDLTTRAIMQIRPLPLRIQPHRTMAVDPCQCRVLHDPSRVNHTIRVHTEDIPVTSRSMEILECTRRPLIPRRIRKDSRHYRLNLRRRRQSINRPRPPRPQFLQLPQYLTKHRLEAQRVGLHIPRLTPMRHRRCRK